MINSKDFQTFISNIENGSFEEGIKFVANTETYKDYLNGENYGSSRSVDVSRISEYVEFFFCDDLCQKLSFEEETTYCNFQLSVIDSDRSIYFDIDFHDLEINGKVFSLTYEVKNILADKFISILCKANGWDKSKAC